MLYNKNAKWDFFWSESLRISSDNFCENFSISDQASPKTEVPKDLHLQMLDYTPGFKNMEPENQAMEKGDSFWQPLVSGSSH